MGNTQTEKSRKVKGPISVDWIWEQLDNGMFPSVELPVMSEETLLLLKKRLSQKKYREQQKWESPLGRLQYVKSRSGRVKVRLVPDFSIESDDNDDIEEEG